MTGAASSLSRTCVLFALPEEAAPFVRLLAESQELRRRCTVAVSGVGAAKAERAVETWLAESASGRLIVCGFAGGLTKTMTPGAILVAKQVWDVMGSAETPPRLHCPDAEMLAMAQGTFGSLATVGQVLTVPQEKRALHSRTGAHIVDMETAGAVRAAERAGVRWLAVRAVTDGMEDSLPFDFNLLADAEGNVDRGRVVRATLAQPWKIPALIRLGSRSARAAKNLTQFLETYLLRLPD